MVSRATQVANMLNVYDDTAKDDANIWEDIIYKLPDFDLERTSNVDQFYKSDAVVLKDGSLIRWDPVDATWYVE